MTVVNLREVLQQKGEGNYEGWLYLAPGPWNLASEGIFIEDDINADPHVIFPPEILAPCKLSPALEATAIEDVIAYAQQQSEDSSLENLLKSFVFYVENDAFLDFDNES